VLRGKDVHELEQMKQMGLSVSAISELTGYDRKTVRKYLLEPEGVPSYGARAPAPSKLDRHKPYLQDRLAAGVWNAQVLLREIRALGYDGSYTILKDWLHPQRSAASAAAVRRFETPPGKQAQVDWGHLGYLDVDGRVLRIWGFTITLGYSRRMWAQAALDQKLGTLLRMHEAAFREWGAVPEEILYDRMKTVWLDTDEREPACLMDFNTELRQWVDTVANRRVHGTTYQQVLLRWDMDQFAMQPLNSRRPYPYSDDELRKVARDAYVSWQASRYSVPWRYVGKEVWVRERNGAVEVQYGGERIAVHARAARKHEVITERAHHATIPLNDDHSSGKILIHMRETAPAVESRSLAVYDSLATAGAQ
jgi:transposase